VWVQPYDAVQLDEETLMHKLVLGCLGLLMLTMTPAFAQEAAGTNYDSALAQRLGADDYGMRSYVFVLLKTGPSKMPEGAERDEMYRGHFANMTRLSKEGKLVLAGPYDGVDGWRGLFVLAVKSIDEARALVATDPVLQKGEMIAEYHRYYGSAALMQVPEVHEMLSKKKF
jgi:uncharacterized protein YciI